MDKGNMRENKMGTMPVNKLILNMAVPMMISMIFQALYNIVDSIFVSQHSQDALTAVSLVYPVQIVLIAVGVGTGVGVNAVLSRSLGEKNQKMIDKIAGNAIFASLMNSLLFVIVALFFVDIYFANMSDIELVVNYGKSYMRIVSAFSIGLFFQIMSEKFLQATGRTMLSMVVQISGVIINVVLDPILIFGWFGLPSMGATGAAIATVTAQIVAAAIGMIMNLRINKDINFKLKYIKPDKDVILKIYKVGLPSIIMQSIGSVMIYLFNIILLTFSDTAATVLGVYYKLQSFFIMPVMGLNNSLVPIIGFNYGAGNSKRIYATIKTAIAYAIAIMILGLVVFQIFPVELFQMFDASPELLEIGVSALQIISYSFVFAGFSIVCSGVFQALGNGVYTLIVSFARQIVVILPVAYFISLSGDVHAVWWSFPIAEIAALGLTSFFLMKINKNVIKQLPDIEN